MRFTKIACAVVCIAGLTNITSCTGTSNTRGASRSSATSSATPTPTDAATGNGVTKIVAGNPSVNTVFTVGNAGNTCADITFTVSNSAGPAAGVDVTFSVATSDTKIDAGKVEAADSKTDTNGQVTASYCSGVDATTVHVIASVDKVSANSGDITVIAKANYTFSFARVDLSDINLFDSGPNDCTRVYFSLQNNKKPVLGVTQRFKTQLDYPKAVKLSEKEGTGLTAVDALTGKKYGYYDAVSDSSGEFTIPLCAGVELGTVVISGVYTTDTGRLLPAQSSPITITTGLASWANISLTFNTTDARTLKGFLETNTTAPHDFTVKVNARQDGLPISNPVTIVPEIGEIKYGNGQLPDKDGNVPFTLMPLHLSDSRPFLKNDYGTSEANNKCKVEDIVAYAAAHSRVLYKDLAMNWRVAITYMTRGQEYFYDSNHNGFFDATGAVGFWDKDQNGTYDVGIDTLTLGTWPPAAGKDWFVDLPTPFVDVNKDTNYTADTDILIGDQYVAANSKRDTDTVIWKSFLAPIYLGTSPYALTRSAIGTTLAENDTTTAIGSTYISTLAGQGLGGSATPALLGVAIAHATANDVFYQRYFFAHDICGNPMPGGTSLSTVVVIDTPALVGERAPLTHFYMQPGDPVLEPARRLLKDSIGGSSATINYNITDHRSAGSSYPVEFYIEIPACTNLCTGDVKSSPGLYCDAFSAHVDMTADTDTIRQNMTATLVNTCNCQNGGSLKTPGVCACPTGYTGDGTTCQPDP